MALGVSIIAAFLGRSFDVRFVGLGGEVGADSETGLDFWASDSGRLVLALCDGLNIGTVPSCCSTENGGGLVSLISGFGPAIDVSGILVFRGGGGVDSRG